MYVCVSICVLFCCWNPDVMMPLPSSSSTCITFSSIWLYVTQNRFTFTYDLIIVHATLCLWNSNSSPIPHYVRDVITLSHNPFLYAFLAVRHSVMADCVTVSLENM